MKVAVRPAVDPLGEIRRELADVRARLARLEAEQRPRRGDDPALLSALALALGSAAFSTDDVLRLAPHNQELATAIGPGVTVRSLGLRLRRLARRGELLALKRTEAGRLWTLRL